MSDFTIADVLAWARTKPAGEEYDFCNSSGCALAQFGKATGREYLIGLTDPRDDYPELGEALNPLSDALSFGHSFGELVARLEKLCPVPQSDWARLDAYLTDIEQVSA